MSRRVASSRKADLPAGARATPMTYEAGGRQFVVIAAGGGGPFGAGDAIIALHFRSEEPNLERAPTHHHRY